MVTMGRRALWLRWVALVTLGEVTGFTVSTLAGIWAAQRPAGVQLTILTAAGLFEGAMLGLAQAAVLHRRLRGLRRSAWVVATSLGGAVAWFLGTLPAATHDRWVSWPLGWVIAAATVLAAALLCTIGTAQALVLPKNTSYALAWVGWTALGWCAGLAAFSAVAPPLWHEGQSFWFGLVVGLAAAIVMAVVMAAVTGVGAVRLVAAPASTDRRGRQFVTSLAGTPIYDGAGHQLGTVDDIVADLASGLDPVPVNALVIRSARGRRSVVPWRSVIAPPGQARFATGEQPAPFEDSGLGPCELLVGRDVLDSPVITADPPRRTRVSDVLVDIGVAEARVVGVDLSPGRVLRRFAGRPLPVETPTVPLSRVHLASHRGHAAQLATPQAMVRNLAADDMAEVLTRASVTHARQILSSADRAVREEAMRLLHPVVRARVAGGGPPPRRARRLNGWRLHRPGRHPSSTDES